jgi:multicomponent Na+:H+ antiporter subunit F
MWIAAVVVAVICAVITVIRIFIGPGAPNRLVAVDTFNTLVVALMVVLAAVMEQVIFADIAIVYALLSFAMTLYVARMLEGKKL